MTVAPTPDCPSNAWQATEGQQWAALIRKDATDPEPVIAAINELTASHRANRGAVMIACAYVLAQCVVAGGPEDAAVIRLGVLSLLDGFSTQVAVRTA